MEQMIRLPGFSMMIFLTTILLATLTPLISVIYDPSKPYKVLKRRTIQHTPPGEEVRILVCIRDKKSVPSLVNLLEITYPTLQNPLSVYAFHLVELIGRANPVFIDHDNDPDPDDLSIRFPDSEAIRNALILYQENRDESVKLHFFTALAAKRTMFQDVCKLALNSKATIIILPLERQYDGEMGTAEQWGGGQTLNTEVLSHAPCSVGLLIDKAHRWHLPLTRCSGGTTDSIGMNFITVFEALKQVDISAGTLVWYLISMVVLVAFLLSAIRPALFWIIDHTPEGQAVHESYVVAILLGVFVVGFLTDMFGLAVAFGPFCLGLLIPNGPPLGATLVEKSETILKEIMMPFAFAFIGLHTDFSAMTEAGWTTLGPLFTMVISGYVSKFLATMIGAFMVAVPSRDSLTLSLVLSLRGQVELALQAEGR
ncbi:hypothetical protein GOBAR_DD35702 [Gossypium barbadense]|nr:hypothetical protein GOBAR_DD35702 [Gossypium barbadense]